jgi:polyhydroxyalkanoate synthesis regulator phasin
MLDDKDIKKLTSILATKSDFNELKSDFQELKSGVEELKSEFKSFRVETRENFDKVNEKIDDLSKVVMGNIDKRIEILEEKILA